MFVKSEKKAIRLEGKRIPLGELIELPDELLPSIQHLVKSGLISVHSYNPNAPKAAPRKAASEKKPVAKKEEKVEEKAEEKPAPKKRSTRRRPSKKAASKGES